jgi:tetratricopeptide (TPR) repeat protein
MSALRKQRPIVRVGLWVLVIMIAVGLLGTTVAWYLDDTGELKQTGSSAKPETEQQDLVSLELKKQQELSKQYEGMRASDPDDLAVLTGSARVELTLGALYLQDDNKEKGQEAFQRAVELYQQALGQQDDLELRLELSSAYQYLEDYEKAEAELQKVLDQDPDNIKAVTQLGMLLETKEDWEGALNIWEQVASSDDVEELTKEFAQSRVEEIKKKI